MEKNKAGVTRTEIIARLYRRYAKRFQSELTQSDVEKAVKTILEEMSSSIAQRKRIEIRGFGAFTTVFHGPRKKRNPMTGEAVEVPEKYLPRFKAGKELRERVKEAPADKPGK